VQDVHAAENLRAILVAEIAGNRVKEIISYAAAKFADQKRVDFHQTMSMEPTFKVAAGQMFERFVVVVGLSEPGLSSLYRTPLLYTSLPV
jgi:hypothetical protein